LFAFTDILRVGETKIYTEFWWGKSMEELHWEDQNEIGE
jgi:hypothetical protein